MFLFVTTFVLELVLRLSDCKHACMHVSGANPGGNFRPELDAKQARRRLEKMLNVLGLKMLFDR